MLYRSLSATLFAVSLAPAQGNITEVIPADYATTEANSSTAFPFASSANTRTMYAYDGSEFGLSSPVRLRGIAFRPNGGGTTFGSVQYDLTMHVSTSTRPATNLSRTFETNHGGDKTRVYNGLRTIPATPTGATPNDFVLYIPFTSRFTWNPRCGPLLVDIQSRGFASGSNSVLIDGQSGSNAIGRIVHRSNENATTADFPASGTQQFGLVAELDLDFQAGPSTVTSTEGNSSSSFPWNRPVGTGMRAQNIYDGSTFFARGRQQIHRLAFRPDNGNAFAGGSYDCTITLSTGVPALSTTMSSTFAANTGPDAKVVFDGILDVAATPGGGAPNGFDFEVPLSETFSYNPAEGSLVVDIQLHNVVSNGGTSFDGPFNTGVGVGRVYDTSDPNATTGSTQDFALSMAFSGYPQPTLPEFDDFTAGGSSSSFPWDSANQPMRVMYAYGLSSLQLLQEQQITHLRWRPRTSGDFGPVTYDCTIDLSTGPADPTTITTVFNNNHGADRSRVFSGKFSVPYYDGGTLPADWIAEVKLDRPFKWNPFAGSLLVDIRVLNTIGTGNLTAFDGSFDTNVHRIAHRTNPNATTADFGPQGFALDLSIGGEGCNGTTEIYGTSCPSSTGRIPVHSTRGNPELPSPNFAYRLINGAPNTLSAMLMGTTPQFVDLTIIGAPGCLLHANATIASFPVSTDTNGNAVVAIPLMDDPSAAGFTFYTTWAIVDLAVNSLGVYTTHGLQSVLCY